MAREYLIPVLDTYVYFIRSLVELTEFIEENSADPAGDIALASGSEGVCFTFAGKEGEAFRVLRSGRRCSGPRSRR